MAAMEGSSKVELFGMWASPAVRRVEWALKMKGIEYEYIEEDLSSKSSSLLKYNPVNKQVPVLVHDGKPIVESLVIVEYIDEVWKDNPILPKDPHERASARFWAKFADDKCKEDVRKVFFAEGEEREEAIKHLEESLRTLDEELKGERFFAGESVGYADLVVGWMAFWVPVAEKAGGFKVVDSKKFPGFAAWIDNFLRVPLVKENLPPYDETRVGVLQQISPNSDSHIQVRSYIFSSKQIK